MGFGHECAIDLGFIAILKGNCYQSIYKCSCASEVVLDIYTKGRQRERGLTQRKTNDNNSCGLDTGLSLFKNFTYIFNFIVVF